MHANAAVRVRRPAVAALHADQSPGRQHFRVSDPSAPGAPPVGGDFPPLAPETPRHWVSASIVDERGRVAMLDVPAPPQRSHERART